MVSGGPAWATLTLPTGLPTQTGSNGLFLTTNGTTASWANLAQVPSVSGQTGLFLGNNGSSYSWMSLPNQLPAVTGQSGKYLTTDGSTSFWTPVAVLPAISGTTSGQVLTNNGTNSYWVSQSSSTTLGSVSLPYTSSVLAVGGSEIDTVSTTCLTFMLQVLTVSAPCRIRLYPTYAMALADNSRPSTTNPTGNAGLFAEFVFSSTALTWVCTPPIICFNCDTVQTTNIYMAIQNMSASSTAITISAQILKMQ